MKLLKSTLLLIITTLSCFSFAQQTPIISQQDLLNRLANNGTETIVLDVRTAAEFADGHIKGAINISHDEINDNLAKILNFKNKTVVVHCRSGRRAVAAENALRAAGFSDLRHLDGDMKGWIAADLPIVK